MSANAIEARKPTNATLRPSSKAKSGGAMQTHKVHRIARLDAAPGRPNTLVVPTK